jgi:PIN domain nuclease of toxin-antitoxin system
VSVRTSHEHSSCCRSDAKGETGRGECRPQHRQIFSIWAIREISVVSLSGVAIKQSIGKLRIGKDEVLTDIVDLRLRVLPYTADHALHLFDLPWHHNDPFDRQIIAQALCEKIPVVTSDEKFNLYEGLRILW